MRRNIPIGEAVNALIAKELPWYKEALFMKLVNKLIRKFTATLPMGTLDIQQQILHYKSWYQFKNENQDQEMDNVFMAMIFGCVRFIETLNAHKWGGMDPESIGLKIQTYLHELPDWKW